MDLCRFSPTLSISGILYLQASLLKTSERAMMTTEPVIMGGEGVRPSLYTVRHRTSWTTRPPPTSSSCQDSGELVNATLSFHRHLRSLPTPLTRPPMVDKAARASQLSELSTAERVTSSPTTVVCPPRSCLPRMLAVPASRVDPGSVRSARERTVKAAVKPAADSGLKGCSHNRRLFGF